MIKSFRLIPYSLIGLLLFIFTSCSSPTIKDDAEKAAELYQRSMEYSMNGKLDAAEKAYQEIQKIMDKYRRENKIKEFHQIYNELLEEKADIIEQEYIEKNEKK